MGGLTYIDTCIWIYLVEIAGEIGQRARSLLRELEGPVAWSALTRMECLVKPFRDGDIKVIDDYERSLSRHQRLDIGPAEFDRATLLRARFGIKSVDALHLATAQTHGCQTFWTNDTRLAAAAGGLNIDVIT